MRKFMKFGAIAAIGVAGFASAPASAIEYSGKTITVVIAYGFGGTYGKYSRTMADHLRRFIPGKPNIIVQSMPGAGGLKASNYAYNVRPRNGYNMFVPPDTIVVTQLLRPKKVKYNASEFRWIGSTNQRLHFLSGFYAEADPRFDEPNHAEIRFDHTGTITVVGFPFDSVMEAFGPRAQKRLQLAHKGCATRSRGSTELKPRLQGERQTNITPDPRA